MLKCFMKLSAAATFLWATFNTGHTTVLAIECEEECNFWWGEGCDCDRHPLGGGYYYYTFDCGNVSGSGGCS